MKDIEGYEGLYAALENGTIWSYRTQKFLKPVLRNRGYLFVTLHSNHYSRNATIHRLVAKTFIMNPAGKSDVNHINGIKTDNRLQNLEWATRAENVQHAYRLGLSVSPSGERSGRTTLKDEQVRDIRKMRKAGVKYKVIARKYPLSMTALSNIATGKSWIHLH